MPIANASILVAIAMVNTTFGFAGLNSLQHSSSLKDSNAYQYRTQLQFTSDYALTLADSHHFKFLAGYSQEYFKQEGFWASRDNMPFDDIDVLGVGSDKKQV